jgi:3-dehydroquinate dehydratase/shikimate dehydrogenase
MATRSPATLLCVPILVMDVTAALADAHEARAQGADVVEFRIDGLDDAVQRMHAAVELCNDSPLPCIVTCRRAEEAGGTGGDEGPPEARLSLLAALAAGETPAGSEEMLVSPPRFVDVELQSIVPVPRKFTASSAGSDEGGAPGSGGGGVSVDRFLDITHTGGASLILSMHDFTGRPADLSRQLVNACGVDPAIVKVAYRARTLRDSLELLDLPAQLGRATIALGIGEFGLLSRLLAPKFGGFLTFAALRAASATAPGQPTLKEVLGMYRFRALAPSTRVYGIIGWPVTQSLSPLVHNAGFDAIAYDGVYVPLPIASEEDQGLALKATLLELINHHKLTFSGASVTIPYKEALVRLAIEQGWTISPLARSIGAANTITLMREPGNDQRVSSVRIDNTDAGAIVEALTPHLRALPATILILGAGGAGRAAAHALASGGHLVVITNRERSRADALAAEITQLGHRAVSIAWEDRHVTNDYVPDAIVQCTPVGMKGGPAGSPLDLQLLTKNDVRPVVFDTVYNPARTPLLVQAESLGLPTIGGIEMFIRQAAAQFELWTGQPAPVGVFRKVLTAQS